MIAFSMSMEEIHSSCTLAPRSRFFNVRTFSIIGGQSCCGLEERGGKEQGGELLRRFSRRHENPACDASHAERRRPLIEAQLANVLGVAPGSAGLRLVRQYKSAGGRILEITDTRYPADRVSVSFQFKRTKAVRDGRPK